MMKRFLQRKNTRMYHVWLRSLMVCLCLALAGVSAWGQETKPEGQGTIDVPYKLDSKEDLEWFRNHVNDGRPEACAVLTKDIDLNPAFEIKEDGTWTKRSDYSGPEIEEPEEWEPIMDNHTLSYTGTFDGAEYTISGLYISNSNNSLMRGLFGMIGNALSEDLSGEVKNLTVGGCIVANDFGAGGLCHTNCGRIYNCANDVTIQADIQSNQNPSYSIGGICSQMIKGSIEKCYNAGLIAGNENCVIGGICGNIGLTAQNVLISNCYNIGELKGATGGYISGICNVCRLDVVGDITISNCHSYAPLESSGEKNIAGICCIYNPSQIKKMICTNNYYNESIAKDGCLIKRDGELSGIIEAESKSVDAFANGEVLYLLQQDNPDVWKQTVGADSYPVFKASGTPTTIYKVSVEYDETMGSVTGEGFNGKEGFYQKGSEVKLTATPAEGYKFVKWIDNQDVETSETIYTIEKISSSIKLEAIFEELPKTYTVNVIDGSADKNEYKPGETVTITADEAPEGKVFAGWTTDDENITFADASQTTTTFIMPVKNVTVTATFTEKEDPTDPEEPVDPPVVDPTNYYNIYNETTYDFIDVSFSRNVVREGGSVNVYLGIPEGLDPAAVTLMFKRSLYGGWENLNTDDDGNYLINNIWTDIYVKAVVDESYIDPNPDENHIYIDLSETNDSIWLYTERKLVEEGKTAVIQAEVAKSCQNKEIRYMYKRTVLGEWKEMPKDYSINQYVVRDITTDIYVKAYFVFDKQDPTMAKNPHHVYADITATCEGLYLDATRHKVADEGDTKVFLYVKKGIETKDARYLFKRSLKGEWEDLVPGIEQNTFQVTDIEDDIYLKGIDAVYTGTEDIDGMVRVYTKDGSLFVYTAQPEEISVVSMTGVTVKRTRQTGLQSYPLNQGIYVICVGEQVFKVRVK